MASAMTRPTLGASQPRTLEDDRLLRGHGRYVADIDLPDQIHAAFLRSPVPHAAIRAIDPRPALARPGVIAVYTAADVDAAGLGDLPCTLPPKGRDGGKAPIPPKPLLARGRVRFVGDTVAMVVADTAQCAKAALEDIDVVYEDLPHVTNPSLAIAPGAAGVWDFAPDNFAFREELGDKLRTDAAFAAARHVVSLDLINNRVVANYMEPRGVVSAYDRASERYTLYTSVQGAHNIRRVIAKNTLKVPEDKLHVIVPDVGGAFGPKLYHYAEEALCLWAARVLDRPVKWFGDRTEVFLCDTHGRDHISHAELALDENAKILGMRVFTQAEAGAYLSQSGPMTPTMSYAPMLSGCYAIPAMHVVVDGVYTNTVPVAAYRGAGRPEAAYLSERMIETAARHLGLASDEIRRRNFIRPDQMPWETPIGRVYENGNFAKNMDDAMRLAHWAGIGTRRAASRAHGRLRGIGMCSYIEACAGGPDDEATIRFEPSGRVTILIGTQTGGQGHATVYAQIAGARLGLPLEVFDVVQGDTDVVPFGRGTGGSRSIPVAGSSLSAAANEIVEKAKSMAARLLQSDTENVTFADGVFQVIGGHRSMSLMEVVKAWADPLNAPYSDAGAQLAATQRIEPTGSTYPNGCHVCEVEIDPETGIVTIDRYVVVDDFGTIVNPLLLIGQIHGGIAQGIGQALMEEAIYDSETGQLVTASFMDYAMPRAEDMAPVEIAFNNIPTRHNLLGAKGAGEAGCIGACAAVINAIVDALSPLGVHSIDMPATPEKIWRAINQTPSPTV